MQQNNAILKRNYRTLKGVRFIFASEVGIVEVILIMCAGVAIGARFFPEKWKKYNEKAQVVCTVVLIFSMGVMLGNRENLMSQLMTMGLSSFALAMGGILGSIIMVYALTQWLMKPEKRRK